MNFHKKFFISPRTYENNCRNFTYTNIEKTKENLKKRYVNLKIINYFQK